ncbi:hypothetical protein JOS77_25435 [Chromobacterium haemolyticum]|nr:hypothetical protein JOS77_25435 [Chromobacterium haemolyticum]
MFFLLADQPLGLVLPVGPLGQLIVQLSQQRKSAAGAAWTVRVMMAHGGYPVETPAPGEARGRAEGTEKAMSL